MGWLYVPELDPAVSPKEDILVWVTINGKPAQRSLSWRGWKTRSWIRPLAVTISDPFRAESLAAKWIDMLPSIHESRIVEKIQEGKSRKGPSQRQGERETPLAEEQEGNDRNQQEKPQKAQKPSAGGVRE